MLDAGGRVTTVLDGWVAVLRAGADPLPVVQVADVPMTLAGLSRVNVENVLAVTSAALALGFSAEQVADGLTRVRAGRGQSRPDEHLDRPDRRPRRRSASSIDLAHNEAGLEALLEIMNGIRPAGARLLLGVGTAGDRSDEVFVRLGEMAALGADVVEIAHKTEYLRGRPMTELGELILEGAAHAGMQLTAEWSTELECLESLVGQARAGDVVAMMAHQDRPEIDAWLTAHGGTRDSADELRAKARRARSEGLSRWRTTPHWPNGSPELLADEPDLTEKRMFGGLAFLLGGHMAVAASSHGVLMVRIDPGRREELLADSRAAPMEMRGRELAGWLLVDLDSADDAELANWVDVGVSYARTLPPK